MRTWDETCDRLLAWKAGQGPSERLAAQVLASEGFSSIDPSHPLGGPDGGADAMCKRGGEDWIMAVYFPRGQQTFAVIKRKFRTDLKGAGSRGVTRIAFVTNQEIHQADRKRLRDLAKPAVCDLYHLDRITTILDQPKMAQVRRQFLGIGDGPDQVAEGGKGGNAPGAAGGGGGAIGGGARGGDGGHAAPVTVHHLPGLPPFVSQPGSGGGGGGSAAPKLPAFDEAALRALLFDASVPLAQPVSFAKGGDGGSAGPVPPPRTLEERDLTGGLRATVLPVNAFQIRGGMLDVLGAGWEWCDLPTVPHVVVWHVVCLFTRSRSEKDAGVIATWLVVQDPTGSELVRYPVLLGDAKWTAAPFGRTLEFTAAVTGVYRLSICSGPIRLAETAIELRCP